VTCPEAGASGYTIGKALLEPNASAVSFPKCMKQAFRHKPAPAAEHKKLVKRVARTAKPKKDERKYTAPIFNTPLAGQQVIYIRPFDPVWPAEPEEGFDQSQQKKNHTSINKKKRFKAPIFNGPLAGTRSHYIRPFDPVWPLDSEIYD
jgi:hypothetical protein